MRQAPTTRLKASALRSIFNNWVVSHSGKNPNSKKANPKAKIIEIVVAILSLVLFAGLAAFSACIAILAES